MIKHRYIRYNMLQRYNGDTPVEPPILKKGEKIDGYYYDLNECKGLRDYNYIRYSFKDRPDASSGATAISIKYNDDSTLSIKYGDINYGGDLLIIKEKDDLLIKSIYFGMESNLEYLDLTHIGKCVKHGDDTTMIRPYYYTYLGETINLYDTIKFERGDFSKDVKLIDLSYLDMTDINTRFESGAFDQINDNYSGNYTPFYIKCTQELKTYLINNAGRLSIPPIMVEDESYFIVVDKI